MKENQYLYIDDLLALDSCRGNKDSVYPIISYEIQTSLHWRTWEAQLTNHPDPVFTNYIMAGIRTGFKIGFHRSQPLVRANCNLHCPRPVLVSDYLSHEVDLGRMWKCPFGVFPKGIHTSPIGLIPKKNRPEAYCGPLVPSGF